MKISNGDEVSIVGNKNSHINGNKNREITGNLTEEVNDDLTVDINGGWNQNVMTGTVNIFSPNEISIKSSAKVSIEAHSSWVKAAVHSFSMTGFNESVTGNSISLTGNSMSGTGMTSSFTTVSNNVTALSNSSKLVSYSTKGINNKRSLTKIEDTFAKRSYQRDTFIYMKVRMHFLTEMPFIVGIIMTVIGLFIMFSIFKPNKNELIEIKNWKTREQWQGEMIITEPKSWSQTDTKYGNDFFLVSRCH
ncbi:hypothetical protein [Pantoea agglomerans]|uniref:hypothetical protein n=1 Tax=Enterobacter agglomerans TaxID=549 RepID=UPI001FDA485D|nr:hypothetical protein [Pantoea agglomerans]